jgi:hypothetical protein
MKALFTWLYVVILKLGEESVPPGMKQSLDAEELKMVIDFLRKRLAKSSTGGSQTFNLELVGQYLVDEDLIIIEERPPSFLEKLLQEAGLDSKAIPWLFSPAPEKSLLQLFNSLNEHIATAFATTKASISETFVPKASLSLIRTMPDSKGVGMKMGNFGNERGKRCVYFPFGKDIILLVYPDEHEPFQCCRMCVRDVPRLADQEKSKEPLDLLSVQVYSGDALSVLFEYASSEREDVVFSAVAQLPTRPLLDLATDLPPENDLH